MGYVTIAGGKLVSTLDCNHMISMITITSALHLLMDNVTIICNVTTLQIRISFSGDDYKPLVSTILGEAF